MLTGNTISSVRSLMGKEMVAGEVSEDMIVMMVPSTGSKFSAARP